VRTLSAADRQVDVLWITAISVTVTIGLDAILIGPLGISGLALASAIALNIDNLVLTEVVRRRFASFSTRALVRRQGRVLAAGLPALGVALALYWLWPSRELGSYELVPVLIAKVAIVLVVFLAAARVLCRLELSEATRTLRAVVAGRRRQG
jgi:peptidoglycan biosynthesis protein MviN/MurJ (putative lipid II flippase)